MAREHWKKFPSGPTGPSCAAGRPFLASPLTLIHVDRLHLRDLTIDVENAGAYRIDLELTQEIQVDLEKDDSRVKIDLEVSMHAMRAFCSDLQG